MSTQNKLYKCYKDGCSFRHDHPDGPYLTQIEYDELLENGQIRRCPNDGYGEPCGIRELDPQDYPRKPKKPIPIKLIASIAVGVVVIGSLIFLFTGKSGDEKPATKAEVVPEVVQPAAVDEVAEPISEPVVAEAPKQTQAAAPAGTQTKNFPNGDRYVGEVNKGLMHGLGTYYYAQRQRISERDRRERMAEAGDYIVGEWFEGKFVQGRLYDKNGNQKEVVIVGR